MQEDTFGFIAIIPQGHSGDWDPEGIDAWAALEIFARVEADYKVDPRRVSLVGVSSGGAGVWVLAAAHPDLWAALYDWLIAQSRGQPGPPAAR